MSQGAGVTKSWAIKNVFNARRVLKFKAETTSHVASRCTWLNDVDADGTAADVTETMSTLHSETIYHWLYYGQL